MNLYWLITFIAEAEVRRDIKKCTYECVHLRREKSSVSAWLDRAGHTAQLYIAALKQLLKAIQV